MNGTTGELTIDMLGPDQVTDAGLRMASQGLCALEIVQDGVAGTGPVNSLELVTDNTGLDEACPAAAGSPAFCGDVTIRSFYTRPLSNLYAQIDSLVPSSGFAVANGDQVVGATSGLGSWAYPNLEAAGGASSATRNWLFNRSGGNFTFTGRVVANVPELCNGLTTTATASSTRAPNAAASSGLHRHRRLRCGLDLQRRPLPYPVR